MITFEKAKIAGNVQRCGVVMTNDVRLVSELTAGIATALDARWLLFDGKMVVRSGFKSTDLDSVFVGATFTHEIAKIGKLELNGCEVSKFKVFRTGDGKKKPKKLMVAFSVRYTGAPFDLVEHLIKVGKGEGLCSVSAPQQERLFEGGKAEDRSAQETDAAPLKLDYASRRGWSANVTVAAVADGFEVTRRANSPSKKLKQVPPAKYASEMQARQEGIGDIRRWAEKIAATGERPEKREAGKLIDWCAENAGAIAEIPAQSAAYPD